ncbi:MAG: ATP-binding protein [Rhodoferax sp.]
MPAATIIALLGAECTGKTTLAQAVAADLQRTGVDAVVVPEALREFCAHHGRTPRADEQAALAQRQTDAVAAAAKAHAVVLADTTALMTAVYSDLYFDDPGLYVSAWPAHRAVHLTLLAAPDLPWVADGLQRDGLARRAAVDERLRTVLQAQGQDFAVVVGTREARTQAALRAVWRCLHPPREAPGTPRWRWVCAHCGDGGCEAALLAQSR